MCARLLLASAITLSLSGCCIPAPGIYTYGPRLLPPMLAPPPGAIAPRAFDPCGQCQTARLPGRVSNPVRQQVCAPIQRVSAPQTRCAPSKMSMSRVALSSLPRIETRRPKWPAARKYPGVVKDTKQKQCGCAKCRQHRQSGCTGCAKCKTGCAEATPDCSAPAYSSASTGCGDCQTSAASAAQNYQPPQVPPSTVEVYRKPASVEKMVPPPAPLPPPMERDTDYRNREPAPLGPSKTAPKSSPAVPERPTSVQADPKPPVPERPEPAKSDADQPTPQPEAPPAEAPPRNFTSPGNAPTAEERPVKQRPSFEDPSETPVPLDAPPQTNPFDKAPGGASPEKFELDPFELDPLEPLENSEIEPVSLKIPVRRTHRTSDNSKMGLNEYETTTIPASSVIRKRIQ